MIGIELANTVNQIRCSGRRPIIERGPISVAVVDDMGQRVSNVLVRNCRFVHLAHAEVDVDSGPKISGKDGHEPGHRRGASRGLPIG